MNDLKKRKKLDFDSALDDARKLPTFKLHKFITDYGIKGKRAEHFSKQVREHFLTNREDSFNALENKYIKLEAVVRPLNKSINPNFMWKYVSLKEVVRLWAKSCIPCQKSK